MGSFLGWDETGLVGVELRNILILAGFNVLSAVSQVIQKVSFLGRPKQRTIAIFEQ